MVNSKLLRLLNALNSDEIKALDKFILSPLHLAGKRPLKVQLLLQYLIPYHPDFKEEEITEEKLFNILFPAEEFNKNKLDKVSSNATKTVHNFIAFYAKSEFQEIEDLITLARFFQERGLSKDYLSAYNKATKMLESISQKGKEYYQLKFYLEQEHLEFQLKTNDKKSIHNLADVINRLDQYFFIHRLQFSYYLLTKSVSTKGELKDHIQLLSPIRKAIEENHLSIPLLEVYYHAYDVLPKANQVGNGNFSKLQLALKKSGHLIPHKELLAIHNFMRNYLANQYIHGDLSALSKLFELLKEQILQKTIYYDGQRIFASTLQNAITVALKLNETDWALEFLEKHKNKIQGADSPEDLYRFHLADIYFYKGEFEKAKQTLDKFHFRELYYNLAVRRLEVKLHFETSDVLEFLESRLNALKSLMFDHQKWLPKDKFEANNNFVKIAYQLFRIMEEKEKLSFLKEKPAKAFSIKISSLDTQIKEEKFLAEREWLLRKINTPELQIV
ncbi:MAG: hypothetical protein KDC24_05445 [Saprospiraceae bacterium]|nr:hypothetical protein [Saprospiraceae bacterium]